MSGTNGTSTTPICDLIETLLSHDLSRGTLDMALRAARPIEATLQAKTASNEKKVDEKRERERLRKAAYRSRIAENVPRDKSGTQDESVLKDKPVDIIVESKKDPAIVPRDIEGQIMGRESDWPNDYREQFWKDYPRKTEKKAALAKLDATRKGGKVPWVTFITGVQRYAANVAGTEERYIKHPTTWLNRGCWDDEFNNKGGLFNEASRRGGGRTFAAFAAELRYGAAGAAAGPDAGDLESPNRYSNTR